MKKILAALLAVCLVLACGVCAYADGNAASGSITIKGTVEGKRYDLYKIFDLTYTGEGTDLKASYTIADSWTAFFDGDGDYIVEANSGSLNPIVVDGKTKYINITDDNIAEFSKAALNYAIKNKVTSTELLGNGGDVTQNALPLGYYLVYPRGATEIMGSNASVCSLTSTVPNAEVVVKGTYPTIDKKIGTNAAAEATSNAASIGDSVPFVITGKVPDMTGYTAYRYVVSDTLSAGLTFNDDIAITLGGNALNAGTDYTVSVDGNSFKIVFKNFINHAADAGEAIVITYSAIVNEKAVIGTNPNTNTAKLIYSNDPKNTGDGDEPVPGVPVGETPDVTTNTYVSAIKLKKVDGKDNTTTLTGAKFSIAGTSAKVVITNGTMFKPSDSGTYYMLKDGTYTGTAPAGNEKDYDSTTQKYEKVTTVNKDTTEAEINRTGYVNSQGVLEFKGLGAGEYTITELVAPDGYNLLTSPITVKIDFNSATNTWDAAVAGKAATIDESGFITFDVANNAGSKLPETGGIGTTIFYIVGGLMMAGAVIVLVTKKKMSVEEK